MNYWHKLIDLPWESWGEKFTRGRRFVIWLLIAGVIAIPAVMPIVAQQPEETLSVEEAEEAATSAAPSSSAKKGDDKKQRSMLDTLLDGGIVGGLLMILSCVAVGFIVEHFMTIRMKNLMPERVVADLETMIARGDFSEAKEYCYRTENASLFSNVVLTGLERFEGSEFGFAEYKSAVEEEGEEQTARLYRKTEVLGLIGSIAPMLGLTGTVLGMIEAFNAIAASGGMAKPDELAGGIGKALVTTLLGLIVAIPAMIAFSYFRNTIDSLVAEAGKRVERVMMPLGRTKK